ncbi:hypothetical protein [Nonomuraea sp. 10N515B]|uniref:hypothetical protein n=1 Tax=Nonomuraea sp. 10N515B TaxID=3457422 RepID=UPI003FCD48F0
MTSLISRTLARAARIPKPPRQRTWTELSPLLRLLILTQLAFNIGFYAVLPFLAEHLGTAIGMLCVVGRALHAVLPRPWSDLDRERPSRPRGIHRRLRRTLRRSRL